MRRGNGRWKFINGLFYWSRDGIMEADFFLHLMWIIKGCSYHYTENPLHLLMSLD